MCNCTAEQPRGVHTFWLKIYRSFDYLCLSRKTSRNLVANEVTARR